MSSDLTLRGGLLALSDGIYLGDLQIVAGEITALGAVEDDRGEVIDATGLLIMPGVIDGHVHFREPGAPHKEDIGSGSRACAAGGVTAFLDMPNTRPPTTTVEALAQKKARASETSVVHYGFYIGATTNNLDVLNGVENVPGIKIFMGASTGDLLVDRPEDQERIFAQGTRLIAVHAEDQQRLEERKARFENRSDARAHSEIRDVESARLAVARALELSARFGRRLHVLHMSTGDELHLIEASGAARGRVSCEVTPQHLLLAEPEVYERLGARAVLNPPIRAREHAEALWRGLHEGTIDCIATDHAPHTLEEKSRAYGEAPCGMPGVETSLSLMLDAASSGRCTVNDVVKWMCRGPARCFGMRKKGRIDVGYDGDLVLVDLKKKARVGERGYLSRAGWSPFDGMELTGWPVMTVVAGQVAFREGEIFEGVRGSEIQFSQ